MDTAPKITATVNGARHELAAAGDEPLVDVIRDRLGLTGTKLVCGSGVCGACTVQLDGAPVASCLLPATAIDGRHVVTVEGISRSGLHPAQRAFIVHDGMQCGYCTPGFVVEAAAFVDRWRAEHGDVDPGSAAVAGALAGHLCRCAAYPGIDAAVRSACRGEHDAGASRGPRVDAGDKVTGAARFTTDVRLPGQLEAVIIRSPHAHARVEAVALEPCLAAGAAGAVELLNADPTVRYVGQPIAAVAGATRSLAVAAAAEADLSFTVLRSAIGPVQALADGAPLVYRTGRERRAAPSSAENPLTPARWRANQRGPSTLSWRGLRARRRINRARRRGDELLVDLDFSTGVQVHTPLEPHACVADWSNPDSLRLWVSTQAVHHLAKTVAGHFGLATDQVEVVAEHVGGGFGAKMAMTAETVAAVELSRQTRRPVRLVYDRHEELAVGGLRPATETKVALLAGRGGRLSALSVETRADGGVSIGSSVAFLAALMYGRSPRLVRDYDIVSNSPPGTPFRGPGGPPMAWALEQAVDAAAHRLGQDPIDLRQRWDGNRRRRRLYDWAAALPVWQDRPLTGRQTGRFRRGVGIAAANWLYVVDPATTVEVAVRDGRLVATTSTQDMGTGSRSVIAGQVASVFEIDPGDVVVEIGSSAGPHGPSSGGSRTTASVAPTARQAAERLKAKLPAPAAAGGWAEVFAYHDGASASARRGRDRKMRPVPFSVRDIQIGRQLTGAVHVSEIEVDTRTGVTRVRHVYGGLAVGRIHAPRLAEAQCESSIIQGIGFALYEQRHLEPHTGAVLSTSLEDYHIPQLGDSPEITLHFDTDGWDHVPGGGVGLGEIATLGVAASIGNAIHNATGWRPQHLPVRPDRMLGGLR
jgi:xanthine dehydrogenase YagR molybdenum-binding subunit